MRGFMLEVRQWVQLVDIRKCVKNINTYKYKQLLIYAHMRINKYILNIPIVYIYMYIQQHKQMQTQQKNKNPNVQDPPPADLQPKQPQKQEIAKHPTIQNLSIEEIDKLLNQINGNVCSNSLGSLGLNGVKGNGSGAGHEGHGGKLRHVRHYVDRNCRNQSHVEVQGGNLQEITEKKQDVHQQVSIKETQTKQIGPITIQNPNNQQTTPKIINNSDQQQQPNQQLQTDQQIPETLPSNPQQDLQQQQLPIDDQLAFSDIILNRQQISFSPPGLVPGAIDQVDFSVSINYRYKENAVGSEGRQQQNSQGNKSVIQINSASQENEEIAININSSGNINDISDNDANENNNNNNCDDNASNTGEQEQQRTHILRIIAYCSNPEFDSLDEYVFSVRSHNSFQYYEQVRFKIKRGERADVKVAVKIPALKKDYVIHGVVEVRIDDLQPIQIPVVAICMIPEIVSVKSLYKQDQNTNMIKIPAKKGIQRIPPLQFKNNSPFNLSLQLQNITNQDMRNKPYDIVVQNFINCLPNTQFFVNMQLKQNYNYTGIMPSRFTIRKILIVKIRSSSMMYHFPIEVNVFQGKGIDTG